MTKDDILGILKFIIILSFMLSMATGGILWVVNHLVEGGLQ